jgi:hypothetical protein
MKEINEKNNWERIVRDLEISGDIAKELKRLMKKHEWFEMSTGSGKWRIVVAPNLKILTKLMGKSMSIDAIRFQACFMQGANWNRSVKPVLEEWRELKIIAFKDFNGDRMVTYVDKGKKCLEEAEMFEHVSDRKA